MSLFTRAKKKEKETPACTCGCCAPKAAETACCPEAENGVCCVKVLGAGCSACHELYLNAQKAVRAMGLDIEIEYVTDLQKVMEYGVMSMPALVVNDRVVSAGKVLKPADVESLLHHAGL